MLRRILMASAGALALTGAAAAADLTAPPPPPPYVPPPPPPMWTGFYIGLNAGGTWAATNNVQSFGAPTFANPIFPLGSSSIAQALAIVGTVSLPDRPAGFIGGGQVGFNYQFGNAWVAGVEADIQGIAGAHKTVTLASVTGVPNFPLESYSSFVAFNKSTDYLGTVRGRLGWLVTPTMLVYGTGGFAYGGVKFSTAIAATESLGNPPYPPVFGAALFSGTRTGWTAGGGLEWMFAPNWSAKVEYLYYDLGHLSTVLGLTQINLAAGGVPWGSAIVQSTTRFNGNIVRAGVNYHFNWGLPPVVAKY